MRSIRNLGVWNCLLLRAPGVENRPPGKEKMQVPRGMPGVGHGNKSNGTMHNQFPFLRHSALAGIGIERISTSCYNLVLGVLVLRTIYTIRQGKVDLASWSHTLSMQYVLFTLITAV